MYVENEVFEGDLVVCDARGGVGRIKSVLYPNLAIVDSWPEENLPLPLDRVVEVFKADGVNLEGFCKGSFDFVENVRV